MAGPSLVMTWRVGINADRAEIAARSASAAEELIDTACAAAGADAANADNDDAASSATRAADERLIFIGPPPTDNTGGMTSISPDSVSLAWESAHERKMITKVKNRESRCGITTSV